jgi:hypothetical protein
VLLDDHQHHATRHEFYYRVVQRLETPNAIMAGEEPGVAGFGVCVHSMQGTIGFQETERRKHPLALPFPCNFRHRIDFEFETLFRMRKLKESIETEALSFSLRGLWTYTRATFEYEVETNRDHVPPEKFEYHRGEVRPAWGFTQFSVLLPTGRTFTRDRGVSGSLLPPAGQSREEVPPDQVIDSPVPDSIAPSLASLPPALQIPRAAESTSENVKAASRSRRRIGRSSKVVTNGRNSAEVVTSITLGGILLLFLIRIVVSLLLKTGP